MFSVSFVFDYSFFVLDFAKLYFILYFFVHVTTVSVTSIVITVFTVCIRHHAPVVKLEQKIM